MPLNIQKVDDAGNAAVAINGAVLGTADNVLAVADYWHYRMDSNTLLGISSGALWGSSAVSLIYFLVNPHLDIVARFQARGSADMNFQLAPAPSVTDSGTDMTPVNFNQTALAPVSGASFYHTATLAASGAVIYDKYIPSGQGKFSGGEGIAGEEWSLAAGTTYGICIKGHVIGTFNLSCEYYTK